MTKNSLLLKIQTPMKTPSFGSKIGVAETSSFWSCRHVLFLDVSWLYPDKALSGRKN
jgi:hypothetical protein